MIIRLEIQTNATEEVKEAIKLLQGFVGEESASGSTGDKKTTKKTAKKTAKKTTKKAAKKKEEEPAEEEFEFEDGEPEAEPENEDEEYEIEVEEESEELDIEDILKAFSAYAKKHGREKAVKILKAFKVKSARDIAPKDYAKMMEKLKK